ncbi:MAG TPA: gamma-glutamyl-gamma-aminobutyrate hydrolase family protein [Bryobacteraceae bacterium]
MSKPVYIVYSDRRKVEPYATAIRDAGMEPVLKEVGTYWDLNTVQGLLLTGGTDVSPEFYGEEPAPDTDKNPDVPRDRMELAIIAEALERDLPILAICRGLQILNVQHGGTLIQHLDTTERHRRRTADPGIPVHPVRIEPGTKLAQIAGVDTWDVNSRHHQAAGRIGEGLRVSAKDPSDGTIEGLERTDRRFVLAVQWHPEDQVPANQEQQKLFYAFHDAL